MIAAVTSNGGILAALLCFGLAWFLAGVLAGVLHESQREKRRQARINAAVQGSMRGVGGPALYARTKGEPFTNVLRRHERDARRNRV